MRRVAIPDSTKCIFAERRDPFQCTEKLLKSQLSDNYQFVEERWVAQPQYKKIPSGETVIAEGEEGTSLYVVISGKVGVYKGEKQINEIGAGGLFGEMAIIEKQRRSATIKTLTETSFLMIEGDDFERLLERNSSISGSVIRTLAGRLRKMLEAGK